ncbi:unnamed protein product, partial [Rotaria socialis]
QQHTKTVTVPNGRRLPLSVPVTSRAPVVTKQATLPKHNDHQTIRETTTEKLSSKKYISSRPRPALFFSSTSIIRNEKTTK